MRARHPGTGAKRRYVAVLALLLAAVATSSARPARAQPPPPTQTAAQLKAEEHYKRARELYSQGAYREALGELEAARALDPNAKELVFNLGVVNEKLGAIDDALRYFRQYAQMDGLTQAEKQKADSFIKRLEGAKREVVPPTPPQPPPKDKDGPPPKGRIDAATIVAASIAVVGLGVGTTFGIKALADRPKSSFVTGRDGSYDDLQRKTTAAHNEAIVADVGFGVGVVAAAVTAYLYLARPKVTPAKSPQAQVSAAPMPGGGAFVVRGTF